MPARRELVEELEPMRSEGLELDAALYDYHGLKGERFRIGRAHPKRALYFTEPGRPEWDGDSPRPHNNFTRLSFLETGRRMTFLGMSVCDRLKGKGLSSAMLDYFVALAETKEKDITGDYKINKPVVALVLGRAGFRPDNRDFEVEILANQDPERLDIPRVRLVGEPEMPPANMRGSRYGPFYEVVPPPLEPPAEAAADPAKVVAIHTAYTLPLAPM